MLKRLELVGFKSSPTRRSSTSRWASRASSDQTGREDQHRGRRALGSGRAGAKSLRGGEMADVIFNGSASRRSLGLAEVTMTFDNSRRVLATEAEEVQITPPRLPRRRGRIPHQQSGLPSQGYQRPFLGSGAGSDAYCIIEQGRVDVLLQASTKERRTIFEEAAGISRFKAKKIETLRRLERVDQNVQRLKRHPRRGGEAAAQRQAAGGQGPALPGIHGPAEGAARRHWVCSEYRPARRESLQGEKRRSSKRCGGAASETAQADAWESDLRRLEETWPRLERPCASRRRTCRRRGSRSPRRKRRSGHDWRRPTTWRRS